MIYKIIGVTSVGVQLIQLNNQIHVVFFDFTSHVDIDCSR